MRSTLALALTLLVPAIVHAQAPSPLVVGNGQFRVVFDGADAQVAQRAAEILVQARDRIVSFFGSPFEQAITVQVLADPWAGKYRYGVSGTLVEYVDRTVGREAIRRALSAASQQELLATFGLAEDQLIEGWRRFVLNGRK